jgi:transcriptional regulator with XRE-family HTH domain
MEPIGDRIAAAREALGLTQAQLAQRLPCNPQTVSNWENGRRQPRYADLVRLAEIAGRPVSWFLGEESASEGWRQVEGGIERLAVELARLQDLVRQRREAPAPPAALPLAPLAGRIDGTSGAIIEQPGGWVRPPLGAVAGLTIYRVGGDQPDGWLRAGDLVALAPTPEAAAGQPVATRDAAGRAWLRAEPRAGETVTGQVAWQWRAWRAAADGDPAAEAAARLAWLTAAEQEVATVEAAIERGDGQWPDLAALCDRVRAEAALLAPIYGSAVTAPAARALSRTARALGERGHYPEALAAARAAEEAFAGLERLGGRSREALNNLYNVSQLALFTGDLPAARQAASQAAECPDWTVRWKALKNLDEIRVSFEGEVGGEGLCRQLLALAEAHRGDDGVQAELALSVAHEIRGNAAFARGDIVAARSEAALQLAAAERAGLPYRVANGHMDAAQYAVAAGDGPGALACVARAELLTRAQDLGDLDAICQAHKAAGLALGGDFGRARVTLLGAIRRAAALGSPRAALLAEMAGLVLARCAGDAAAEADHLAAARAAADTMGMAAYQAVLDRWERGA